MPITSVQIQAKSYRYLRIAMVLLLVALAAAVFYQSGQQGSLLASVSAYYYTPAQAVFVGALIGLGASMIALQGMNDAEDMFLNLGGMFAIVVAIVPTGRGADFKSALKACRESGGTLLTQRASKNPDCPTMQALVDATRANVENNMAALLIVGFLAIVTTVVFLLKDRPTKRGTTERGTREHRRWVLAGSLAAVLVWLLGLIALTASVDWLVDNAHYIAAAGLLLSILAVAGANAFRRGKQRLARSNGNTGNPARSGDRPGVVDVLKSPPTYRDRYTSIAAAMLVVAIVLIVLSLTHAIPLFWAEISVAALFILFWTVQTFELEARRRLRVRQSEHPRFSRASCGRARLRGLP